MHEWEPVASNGFGVIFRMAEAVVPPGGATTVKRAAA
jgi:hypothetical protein